MACDLLGLGAVSVSKVLKFREMHVNRQGRISHIKCPRRIGNLTPNVRHWGRFHRFAWANIIWFQKKSWSPYYFVVCSPVSFWAVEPSRVFYPILQFHQWFLQAFSTSNSARITGPWHKHGRPFNASSRFSTSDSLTRSSAVSTRCPMLEPAAKATITTLGRPARGLGRERRGSKIP